MNAEDAAQAFEEVAREYDSLALKLSDEIQALQERVTRLYDERSRLQRIAGRQRDAARDIRSEAKSKPSAEGHAVRLHNGENVTLAQLDGLTTDNTDTLGSATLPHGHIFIEFDGQAYGSLALHSVVDGQAHIELGQYDPTFDQWAPQNPITDREKD